MNEEKDVALEHVEKEAKIGKRREPQRDEDTPGRETNGNEMASSGAVGKAHQLGIENCENQKVFYYYY